MREIGQQVLKDVVRWDHVSRQELTEGLDATAVHN
jgi:hypothetical protein